MVVADVAPDSPAARESDVCDPSNPVIIKFSYSIKVIAGKSAAPSHSLRLRRISPQMLCSVGAEIPKALPTSLSA